MNVSEQMQWIFDKNISDNLHILVSTKGDVLFTSKINKTLIKRRISTSNINVDLNVKDLETLFNSNQELYKTEYSIIQQIDDLISSKIINLNVN